MAVVTNPAIDAKTRGIIVHIVEKIKSEGVFDRFRRDCLEELDSKEPYRQLKQRVESHVATYLSKQVCSPSLPKNQLRNSLRANISQSEVLSKGVDRLLEQVLIEKSGVFYCEIEDLVHEYLSSIGHYSRFDRERQQHKFEQKLSDKEIDDFIKEETNRFLEANAEVKVEDKAVDSIPEPLPASEDQTDASTQEHEAAMESETSQEETVPESSDTIETSVSEHPEEVDRGWNLSNETDDGKNEVKETCDETDGYSLAKVEPNIPGDKTTPEIEKEIEDNTDKINKGERVPSPVSTSKAEMISECKEKDNEEDLGSPVPVSPKATDLEAKCEKVSAEVVSKVDTAALSDSDITVSSVHTSDLSSLEDSFSDVEFEDYKELAKKSVAKSRKLEESSADVKDSKNKSDVATTDVDEAATVEDSDFGKVRSRAPKQCRRISSDLESECSDEASSSLTEDQKDVVAQRRSARVASKDRVKVEEECEEAQVSAQPSQSRAGDESIRLEYSDTSDEPKRVRGKRKDSADVDKKGLGTSDSKHGNGHEKGNGKSRKRDRRVTSDSTESDDVKQSKRSKRTIRPTRCYSPSENF